MAVTAVLVCLPTGAQVRNTPASVHPSPAHGKAAAKGSTKVAGSAAARIQTGQQANVIQISPTGQVSSSVFAPSANYLNSNNFSGVPGLGFDFPHLAAVGGMGNSSSSPFGRPGRHGRGTYIPILFAGYPYSYNDSGADQTDQQTAQPSQTPPQVIVIQQPAPAQQGGDPGNDLSGNASPSVPDIQAADIPDVGDFILVRRDGRLLFASLFSVVGTQLQYITPEGIRRTLAISDLDTDATQQMNEARGTVVQFTIK
jgi:hypothetical protein